MRQGRAIGTSAESLLSLRVADGVFINSFGRVISVAGRAFLHSRYSCRSERIFLCLAIVTINLAIACAPWLPFCTAEPVDGCDKGGA